MSTLTTQQHVDAAVASLVFDAPFFASILLKQGGVTPSSNVTTASTDGHGILYNPEWAMTLSRSTLAGVFAHEIMHIVGLHHLRQHGRDHENWNIACDYAINGILLESGFSLPDGALVNPAYADKTAEQIYNSLPKKPKGDKGGKGGKGGWAGNKDDGKDGQDGDDAGDFGGCGGFKEPTNDNCNTLSEAEINQEIAETRVAVQQAASAAKACGKLPSSIERLVKEIVEPKLDWREILARFLERIKSDQYSWAPPNRRFIGSGIYLPSVSGQALKPVVIAVDTSGSIGEKELADFQAEINGVLDSYPCEVTVIYCDAAINGVEKFRSEERPITIKAMGGGGTDFRPPFSHVDKEELDPSCLIYLTDLCCHSYPDEPSYPTLWVCNDKHYSKPPFGEVAPMF